MVRILSLGRPCQDTAFIMPWGLWDCGETAETFFAMFVNDRFFATELQKHVDDNYLFKRHVTLLICDGAAIAHNTGTSGHAVRCSVCARAVVCAVRCARLMCVLCAECAGDTRL